jgi:hypothetical protein
MQHSMQANILTYHLGHKNTTMIKFSKKDSEGHPSAEHSPPLTTHTFSQNTTFDPTQEDLPITKSKMAWLYGIGHLHQHLQFHPSILPLYQMYKVQISGIYYPTTSQ